VHNSKQSDKPRSIPTATQQNEPDNFYSCLAEAEADYGIIDSGTTGHLAPHAFAHTLTDVVPAINPVTVMVSNQDHMESTHTGSLPIKGLPPAATHVDIIPGMSHTAG
jgi:hypothetical protein